MLWNASRYGVPAFLLAGCLNASVGQAAEPAWPPGEGQALAKAVCTACHSVTTVARSSGYDAEAWAKLFGTMVALPAAESVQLATYLAEVFPPRDHRAAQLRPGPHHVAFEQWQVPTLGQRSRDPVEAPDGRIWWVGQWGNLAGVLDPETGAMREYPLPAGTYPHSVTLDASGTPWLLGNKNGTLQRLDPETGAIAVFPMPDPEAKDPHTGEFDAAGRLLFTLQQSNRVGRFDPATGQIDLIVLDRPKSRPYGIKFAPDGAAWVACNGGPCLYRIDPDTLEQTRVDLPNQESHVRRLDVAADGTVWYVNSGAGRLGQYNPKTQRFKEWPSPSGPASHPYALVVVDGIVWYNESGVRPDPLVRFDPQTETFQSWPIPSSGVYAGILRHMRADRAGRLLIHQSATNHLLRVSPDPS
ncbi:MAG: cytochrome C [Pseudomonadales bacterium]|jgi:virginiamycin B lyase|nr:cytochrome C [Pseudomonadales bacterium]MBL6808267.1 cytochrome C [Pseudomonadales bacterium]